MTRRIASLSLTVAIATAGCNPPPHVALHAPTATASEAERLAAYERLFVRADAVTAIVSGNRVTSVSRDYLILGDGTRVSHADDLLPVVPADSPTAHHARLSRKALDRGKPWVYVGLAVVLGSLATAIVVPLASDRDSEAFSLAITGGIVGTGTGLGIMWLGTRLGSDFGPERDSAFATYDSDLRRHLDLCGEDREVRACAMLVPAPVPASPAADAPVAPVPAAPTAPATTPTAPE